MRGLGNLRADGTERVQRAVGLTGTVYLRIPGQRAGQGKVQVKLQNRTVEYLAVTDHLALATGTAVVVTQVVAPDIVAVEPVSAAEGVAHV